MINEASCNLSCCCLNNNATPPSDLKTLFSLCFYLQPACWPASDFHGLTVSIHFDRFDGRGQKTAGDEHGILLCEACGWRGDGYDERKGGLEQGGRMMMTHNSSWKHTHSSYIHITLFLPSCSSVCPNNLSQSQDVRGLCPGHGTHGC